MASKLFLPTSVLLVATLTGCEAAAELADDFATAMDELQSDDEPAEGGDPAAAVASTDDPAGATEATTPVPPPEAKSTTVGSLFPDDPPFVLTYVPFKAMVTSTADDKQLDAEAELPEPIEGIRFAPAKDSLYTVRVEGVEDVLAQQRHPEWCWAACSEAVNLQESRMGYSRFEGEMPTQEQLAEYFKGDAEVQTAPVATIMRAINLDLEMALVEDGVTAQVAGNPMSTDELVDALLAGRLAILGFQFDSGGHACVAIGATFGFVAGGDADEDLRKVAGSIRKLEELGITDEDDTSGHVENVADFSGEYLFSKYAVHEVFYLDPLEEGVVKKMGANELEARCKIIMTSELARKILLGEGYTGHSALGRPVEEAAEDELK